MNKREFLAVLRKGLAGIPRGDMEERVTFYTEMIDDRLEESLTEEQAVAELGPVENIVAQIMSEIPPARSGKEKAKPGRSLRVWEILLLVLGSPLWLSLLAAALAVALAVYAVIWSAVLCLWALVLCAAVCSVSGILSAVVFCAGGNIPGGIVMLGTGAMCGGLGIFGFFGCKGITKGVWSLTKGIFLWMRSRFVKKEAAQ